MGLAFLPGLNCSFPRHPLIAAVSPQFFVSAKQKKLSYVNEERMKIRFLLRSVSSFLLFLLKLETLVCLSFEDSEEAL